jgi:glycosyltransferase involved in cell wall biosynthesis
MIENNFKLQLIVPHFNEDQELVARFLDSIKMQQLVNYSDIEVIIINDGNTNLLTQDLLEKYPFSIKYFIKDWEGPAAARQYGLNKATANYVMFCDCDDMFFRVDVLYEFFQIMDEKNPDVITSQFMTTYNFKGNRVFSPINKDDIWIHGKVWKLSYLQNNSIEWDSDLKICEDATFTRLGLSLTENIINLSDTTYYWDQRPNSYSSSFKTKGLEAYLDRIYGCESLVKKLLKLNKKEIAAKFTFLQIYECYFELQRYEWQLPELIESRKKVEDIISEFMRNYDYLVDELDYKKVAYLINLLRERYYLQTGRVSLEEVSFLEWKKYLIDTYIAPKETY